MSNQKFSDNSLWLFENFVTTAIKKINPISRYEQPVRVGKFLAEYINLRKKIKPRSFEIGLLIRLTLLTLKQTFTTKLP